MRRRDPTRRNRNIGTAKRGHGADNKLVIPESLDDFRAFFEKLPDAREVEFELHGSRRVALVQPPQDGFVYGCTVCDLQHLLAMLPEEDVEGLDVFLFRQPTRKQRILQSVWGRFIYYATPGKHRGSAICFESQRLGPLLWTKSVDPEKGRELERLDADGHEVTYGKREITIDVNGTSLRNTQLFRTALHEVGHYVDWMRSVINVDGTEAEEDAASRAFESKPSAMKEDFAHRYATEMAEQLRAKGALPFAVRWDEDAMQTAGIERSWFVSAT